MSTFLSDDFADADGKELKLHTGAIGSAWNQPNVNQTTLGTGSAVIASNRLRGNSTGAVCYLASAVPADRAQGFTAVFRFFTLAGNSPWIGFRMGSAGTNGYRFGYDVSDGHWKLQYNSSNGGWTTTQIDFAQSLSAGDYTVVLTVDNQLSGVDNCSVTIDGGSPHTAILSITNLPGCPAVMFDAAATASTNSTGVHIDSLTFTQTAALSAFPTKWAFVMVGDSLSVDYNLVSTVTIPQLLGDASRFNTDRFWNLAWLSQTLVDEANLYATQVAPLFALTAGYDNRLAILFGGNNDCQQNADAATLRTRTMALHTLAHATGWITAAATITYHSALTAAQNNERNIYNDALRADHSFADKFADIDADQSLHNPYDTSLFQSDAVHWASGGRVKAADRFSLDIRRQVSVGAGGRRVSIFV